LQLEYTVISALLFPHCATCRRNRTGSALVGAQIARLPACAFLAHPLGPIAQRLMIDIRLTGHITDATTS
jgi:hypothetical protein